MKRKMKMKGSSSTFFLLSLLLILIIFIFILFCFYRSMSDASIRENFLGIGIDVNQTDAWCDSIDGAKPCINKRAHNEGLEEEAPRDPVVENGICLTENGEWGVRLKEYGRKCISLDIVKNKQNNIQLGLGMGGIIDSTSGAIISSGSGNQGIETETENNVFGINMNRVPPIAGKNQTECVEVNGTEGNREEILDQECKNKFGEQYGLERIVECDPQGKRLSGKCSTNYFNGHEIRSNMTPQCHYYTENLDEICKKQMNDSFMTAENVMFGANGGCYKENKVGTYDPDTGKVRIICGDNAKPNETNCLTWQTNFEEECKKRGGNGKVISKILSNCPIGKRRAVCEI
jgi:hypothetical protein